MVKFGEAAQEARDPEWRDYYVNYNRMKGWIHETETTGSLEAAQHFFDELTLSIERVEAFYTSREAELVKRAEQLVAGGHTPGESAAKRREQEVSELHGEVDRLDKYAAFNMEALRKIAKKFDKSCGVGRKAAESPTHGGGVLLQFGRSATDSSAMDWGLVHEELQPRILKRFPNYRFGQHQERLSKVSASLEQWAAGRTDGLREVLLKRRESQLQRRQSRNFDFSDMLTSGERKARSQHCGELWNSLKSQGPSILYFTVLTGVVLFFWYRRTPSPMHIITTSSTQAPTTAPPAASPGLGTSGYVVIWTTLVTLTLLVWQWPSDCVMLAATLFLNVCGLLDTTEAWGAFSNDVVLSVAALSVVGDAVSHTGFIDIVFAKLLGNETRLTMAMIRIFIPCAIGAALISNTCVMACSMPAIELWCEKTGNHVAFFFAPVSYLMLMAGTFAIFSTSTNLVAQGLLKSQNLPQFGTFDLGLPALAITAAALAYLVIVAPVILRRFRKQTAADGTKTAKEPVGNFLVRLRVLWRQREAKKLGKSGLLEVLPRGLESVTCIERHGTLLAPPTKDEADNFQLNFDDILSLRLSAGAISLLRRLPGFLLLPLDNTELYASSEDEKYRELVEVILDQESPLVGKEINQVKAFDTYGGAVVAMRIRTNHFEGVKGEDMCKKVPQRAVFSHGDQVVLHVAKHFFKRWQGSQHFLGMRKLGLVEDQDKVKAYIAGAILTLMLVFVAFSILPLFVCAVLAIYAMVLTKCATIEEVKKGVRLSVVLTIVGAFGVGNAIGKHGVAQVMASKLVATFEPLGHTGLLFAVAMAVVGFGVIFHGTAVVALMFPLCVHVSDVSGIPLHQMMAVLMYSVACQMLSPICYNTNLMAYAQCPEYEFMDFPKLGAPLVVIVILIAIPMCQWCFPY